MPRGTTTSSAMTNSPGPKSLTRPDPVESLSPLTASAPEPTESTMAQVSAPDQLIIGSGSEPTLAAAGQSSEPTPSSSLPSLPSLPVVVDPQCTATRLSGSRRKYSAHEVTALVMGVQRYADDSCPWSCILHDVELAPHLHGRSGVDLKDKWRTLVKTRPELQSYMENRVNQRQYRPFSQAEELALIEGVRQYSGERNLWSMILHDTTLKEKFDRRSNVQLKDKFRTMKRAGQIIEVPDSDKGKLGQKNIPANSSSSSTAKGTTKAQSRKRKTPETTNPPEIKFPGDSSSDAPETFNV